MDKDDKHKSIITNPDIESEDNLHIIDRITLSPDFDTIVKKHRESIWSDINKRISRRLKKHSFLKAFSVAATILLLLGLTSYFSYQRGSRINKMQMVEVVNPSGTRSSLILPDGTNVLMNAETELTYPSVFVDQSRNVEVKGEAYFNVAHDKGKPFIVNCNDVKIKVFGTDFNVKAYDDDDKVEVTLIEGSIGVELENSPGIIYIKPDEQLVFNKRNHTYSLQQVDVQPFIAWQNGHYYFKELPLKEIVKQLGRIYNVQFEITSGELGETTFSGDFTKGESLEQILRIMTSDQRIKYSFTNNKIFIKEK